MELLQVPPMSAEQLLRKHIATAIPVSPYDPVNGKPQGYEVPYRHLFNFFLGADGSAGNAPYYYRLLEYVQAPSQFVGTDTYLKPSQLRQPVAQRDDRAESAVVSAPAVQQGLELSRSRPDQRQHHSDGRGRQ